MTAKQLTRAVAGATGESPRTVESLGFGPLRPRRAVLEPEDLVLAVDCPFCGRVVRLEDSIGLAECEACDVEFEHSPGEVRAVARSDCRAAVPAA